MIRKATLLLVLMVAASHAHAAINHNYQIRGDQNAAPVQVFDDGRSLYVQIRDPRQTPAPVGPNGPVAFTIRGYYLVMPIMQRFSLHYGQWRAEVYASSIADLGGVEEITRPVQALEEPVQQYAVPQRPAPAQSAFATTQPPSGETVSGEIEVVGAAGKKKTTLAGARQLAFTDAAKAEVFASSRGRAVVIQGDGSVAGATAARQALGACQASGATCTVNYQGGQSGSLTISER